MLRKKLYVIADIRAGGTPSRNNPDYWNGNIPWVKISNINGKYVTTYDETITELGLKNSSAKLFEKETILYTIFATLGRVGILQFDATTNQAIAGIKIKDNSISTDYLYYYLRSLESYVKDIGNGAAQQNINQTILKNFTVPVISKEKQNQICSELENIENVLLKKQHDLASLDELIKSRFIEMFGDPNFNDKNWDRLQIRDIGECVAGATPSTKVNEYWENGTISWLSSGEVHKRRIYSTDSKITQSGYDHASTKMVPAHTVLLAMAGQGKTRGTAAMAEIPLCTNQSICSIVNNEKINPEYLMEYLTLEYNELRSASNGGEGRGGLNLKIIGDFPINVPPINLQNEYAEFIKQIDKSKFIVQKEIKDLQELLDKKMDEYFGQ